MICCSLCVSQAVLLADENAVLASQLEGMTAREESAVAAALAATDEKHRLEDQVYTMAQQYCPVWAVTDSLHSCS
jgi:hypothetical protein